jgi:DNA polymerase III epsilon subunit-like protein
MSIVVFDVETTGLPKKRNRPFTEFENWPYIVQLSWVVYNNNKGEIESINDHIIKIPDHETIPYESIKIHGITNEIMRERGEDLVTILMDFKRDISNSKVIVAHNLDFDTSVISVELLRNNLRNAMYFYRGKKYCTMLKTKHLFKRWPKLINLHIHFFGTTPKNLHNSLIDVYVCFRCFCYHYYGYDPVYDESTMTKINSNNKEFRGVFKKLLT